MIQTNQPCDPHIHQLAIQLARACRNIVQTCLREEEWAIADLSFYEVIRQGLEDIQRGVKP